MNGLSRHQVFINVRCRSIYLSIYLSCVHICKYISMYECQTRPHHPICVLIFLLVEWNLFRVWLIGWMNPSGELCPVMLWAQLLSLMISYLLSMRDLIGFSPLSYGVQRVCSFDLWIMRDECFFFSDFPISSQLKLVCKLTRVCSFSIRGYSLQLSNASDCL